MPRHVRRHRAVVEEVRLVEVHQARLVRVDVRVRRVVEVVPGPGGVRRFARGGIELEMDKN